MEIKNIVFDMGGVIIDFDPDRSVARHFPEDCRDLVKKTVFGSKEWLNMDRGTLGYAEGVERICSALPEELRDEARLMIVSHEEEMPPIPEMFALVKSLSENGYGLYLLTNCPAWFHEFKPRVPAFAYFDGFIVSADHKRSKPEKEIYNILLDTYSLRAEECFFVDDSPVNAAAAEKLGIRSYCFSDRDAERLKAVMREHGIKV